MNILKSLEDIEKLRISSRIVAEALTLLKENTRPGITTLRLNKLAEEFINDNAAVPSFKGYLGYPFTICASINEEVVHGFPSKRVLKEGDVLSIDVGALKNGFHGDSAITIPIGEVCPEKASLIRVGQECLYLGISFARDGNRLQQISAAIQNHAEKNNYNVIRQYVGHGIGLSLHEPPQIPNYIKEGADGGLMLKRGMVLAIEPMVTLGESLIKVMPNEWTAVTKDQKLSVHWEHTVAITKEGVEVLSLRADEKETYKCLTKKLLKAV
jgi:methionyl aminopeptidase